MKIIILVSHGRLAEGMKSTIKMLSGQDKNIYAFGLLDGENVLELHAKAEEIVVQHADIPVVIVTDMPGGSVNTNLTPLLSYSNVHLLSGMNTMQILNLVLNENITQEVIEQAVDNGKETIVYVNSMINKKDEGVDFFD